MVTFFHGRRNRALNYAIARVLTQSIFPFATDWLWGIECIDLM